MNVLGHAYVAHKATGKFDPYFVAGLLIPDIVPYVPSEKYTYENSFEKIHEGGKKLLEYLDTHHPEKRALGLGMMADSVEYGGDRFNKEIKEWLLKKDESLYEKLTRQIVDCSGVSYEVAYKWRIHNYLWTGLDLYIIKNDSDFFDILDKTRRKIELDEITHFVSQGLGLNEKEIARMLTYFFDLHDFASMKTIDGYVRFWKKIMAGLPEKDIVDIKKTKKLMEEIYTLFEDEWPRLINTTSTDIHKRLKPYLL